jgi:hypothetical protein
LNCSLNLSKLSTSSGCVSTLLSRLLGRFWVERDSGAVLGSMCPAKDVNARRIDPCCWKYKSWNVKSGTTFCQNFLQFGFFREIM